MEPEKVEENKKTLEEKDSKSINQAIDNALKITNKKTVSFENSRNLDGDEIF